MKEMEKVIKGLECCSAYEYKCGDCPYQDDGAKDDCYSDELYTDAIALLKAQEATINDLYTRYEVLCKKIREKYESDDVCGLCQYDGAYVGESGDWMNECPGFETNECFCMKNSIRKMCGQPLIEEP
jgi:hypothetical protein